MNWQPPSATAPEEFADVLMAVHGEAHAAEGFRDHCGTWWYSTGHEVPANAVYAFAELPDCPVKPTPKVSASAFLDGAHSFTEGATAGEGRTP